MSSYACANVFSSARKATEQGPELRIHIPTAVSEGPYSGQAAPYHSHCPAKHNRQTHHLIESHFQKRTPKRRHRLASKKMPWGTGVYSSRGNIDAGAYKPIRENIEQLVLVTIFDLPLGRLNSGGFRLSSGGAATASLPQRIPLRSGVELLFSCFMLLCCFLIAFASAARP